MKMKSNIYGVFYKDDKKWHGPIHGKLLTKQEIVGGGGTVEDYLKICAQDIKKKVKIFRQIWKSI